VFEINALSTCHSTTFLLNLNCGYQRFHSSASVVNLSLQNESRVNYVRRGFRLLTNAAPLRSALARFTRSPSSQFFFKSKTKTKTVLFTRQTDKITYDNLIYQKQSAHGQ
jgi:hypothetical protein